MYAETELTDNKLESSDNTNDQLRKLELIKKEEYNKINDVILNKIDKLVFIVFANYIHCMYLFHQENKFLYLLLFFHLLVHYIFTIIFNNIRYYMKIAHEYIYLRKNIF